MSFARVLPMLALLLGGCGPPSYIVFEIDAQSDVRASINKLIVFVYSARDVAGNVVGDAVPLSDMQVAMEPSLDFPITYGTQTSDSTPARLAVAVEGFLFTSGVGDVLEAATPIKEFSWAESEVTRVKLPSLALLR